MINLDRPLAWQKNNLAPDQYGQQVEQWVTHKVVWCHKMPSKGGERYEANQKVEILPTQYVVRWDEDWKAKDRLNDNGEILEITSISEYATKSNSFREHFLLLTCVSRDSKNTGRDE